jgi:UDP-2,3-diacylglucosamine hydrolase
MRRLWIFSDLHLTDETDGLYGPFLTALSTPSKSGDAVVFNGDIFDFLMGENAGLVARFPAFFEKCRQLTSQGVKLYYIEGNHDFHLSCLSAAAGFEVCDPELLLQTECGKKIYITHGDLIDQEDRGYLRLRKLFRSSFVRIASGIVSTSFLMGIAKRIGRTPTERLKQTPSARVRACFRTFAENKIKHGVDFVVLGHSHDLDEVAPSYFNMGYPPIHRQYLYFEKATGLVRRPFPAG